MNRRVLIVEGPDDLTAVRELATWLFHARLVPGTLASGGGGQAQKIVLGFDDHRVEVVSAKGKDNISTLVTTQLGALPPQVEGDSEFTTDVGVVFDPDLDDPPKEFHSKLVTAVAALKGWSVEGTADESSGWFAVREGSRVRLHSLPWRAPMDPFDGLGPEQNLDRLMCSIARSAFPAEAQKVEAWLNDFPAGAKRSWKSAMHLWCAVVASDQSETSAPAQFLHQNKKCKPVVEDTLQSVRLLEPLRRFLGA